MNMNGFLKMVGTHVKAELRTNVLGAAVFNLIITPLFILAVGKWVDRTVIEELGTTIGSYMIMSMTAGLAALIIIQLSSEMMMERSSGVLLRARSLPHGPLAWSIGKSISVAIIVLMMQVVVLVGGLIFFTWTQMSAGSILLVIVVMVLSLAAHAPIGLIVGSISRGVYSNVIVVLGVLAVFATSGIAFPIDILPRWIQVIQMALPTFWSGHLVRSVILPAESGAAEVMGSFQPALAVSVLAVWTVVGFVVAAFLVKRFFRHESIGAMQKMQASLRSQLGA